VQRDVALADDSASRDALRRERDDEGSKPGKRPRRDGGVEGSAEGSLIIEEGARATLEDGEEDEEAHEREQGVALNEARR